MDPNERGEGNFRCKDDQKKNMWTQTYMEKGIKDTKMIMKKLQEGAKNMKAWYEIINSLCSTGRQKTKEEQ